MTRSGIQYPDIIDLTTEAKDGTVRLILAETEALTGTDVPALKLKLDNYLAYARSGQLPARTPSPAARPVLIRVDLYAPPDQLILVFLRQYRLLLEKAGVGLEVSLNQQDLAL